ncbi:MAG TPA: fibronectin type III domain-containing protein, partial [Solirubrobacterales bacterium]|nr:fibronectin type III domain-containing protein [Solirubrobacterales bacterium]
MKRSGENARAARATALAALACAATVLLGSTLALAAGPKVSWGFGAAHTRLKGTVLPEGKATAWSFDYIPDNLYQQNLLESKPPFQGATSAGSGTVSGSTKEGQVEARIDPTSLTHGTTYHVRLRVENEDGTEETAQEFTAASQAPSATTLSASHVLAYLAVLNGAVNPNGDPTAAWFEYGTADCESNPCAAVPPDEEGEVGAGAPFTLSGLSPETTYHYRLLAENSAGLSTGTDQTFTTPPAPPSEACPNEALREEQHATYLPDCRAYEMVSPADKNGGNLIANAYRTRAAADGSAIGFQSLTPFGELSGSSVATDYLAERSAEDPGPTGTGWQTHGISPPQDASPYNWLAVAENYPASLGEFTPSDGAGVFRAPTPLTEDPDV